MTHTEEFEKTLTEEQVKAPLYTDWDNETLGALVRAAMKDIEEYDWGGGEWERLITSTGAIMLIDKARRVDGDEIEVNVSLTNGEKWQVIARKHV